MRAPHLVLRPRIAALLAANVVAAAVAAWPFVPQLAPAAHAPGNFAGDDSRLSLRRLLPLADFAATAERPLFSPSRRPPIVAAAAAHGEPFAGHYRLVGVVSDGAARRALIADSGSGRSAELRAGQSVGLWRVKSIGVDRVVLASPAGEMTLTLGDAKR